MGACRRRTSSATTATAARRLKRPALDALRDKARMRELEVVVVPSPDRLARNYVHQMVLIEEFEKDGCQVEFVERPMSSEPNDQLLLQIRGAVAEYERTLLAERMRRGRLAKYKAGLLLPWTHTPYGLRVDPDRPRDPAGVRPDEAKAAVVAEIFAAYLEPGASLFGVSRHLREMGVPAPRGGKAWSTATLRGILTNPVYAGKVYAGRVRYRPAKIRRSATHPIGHPHDSSVPLPEEEWIFVARCRRWSARSSSTSRKRSSPRTSPSPGATTRPTSTYCGLW